MAVKKGEEGGEGEGEVGESGVVMVVASSVEEEKEKEQEVNHPFDFHVCGPRNISAPNWKDVIRSSWFVLSLSVIWFLVFLCS